MPEGKSRFPLGSSNLDEGKMVLPEGKGNVDEGFWRKIVELLLPDKS